MPAGGGCGRSGCPRVPDHPLRQVLRQLTPACCPGRVNFHCHTLCSDGSLSPLALAQQALDLGLEHLAITDHHSLAAHGPAMEVF